MKYKISEKKNYILIEILESQLNKNHHFNLKKLLTEIKLKEINNIILNMKSVTHFNISSLPMLLFGNNLFGELGSFALCKIPLNLEKIIKSNLSDYDIDFAPAYEEDIKSVMLTDLEKMLKNDV